MRPPILWLSMAHIQVTRKTWVRYKSQNHKNGVLLKIFQDMVYVQRKTNSVTLSKDTVWPCCWRYSLCETQLMTNRRMDRETNIHITRRFARISLSVLKEITVIGKTTEIFESLTLLSLKWSYFALPSICRYFFLFLMIIEQRTAMSHKCK